MEDKTPETRELTSLEIKQFDELAVDRAANELTLKVALGFHSNEMNRISKQEKDIWGNLIERFHLDRDTVWRTKTSRGFVEVVEKTDD